MSAPTKPSATIICKYAPICPPDKNCLKCADLLEMKIVQWEPQAQTAHARAHQMNVKRDYCPQCGRYVSYKALKCQKCQQVPIRDMTPTHRN